jgi:glutamate/tyrosine decarboxylase-like PLP-dependent enzyme
MKMRIPAHGRPAEEIKRSLEAFSERDLPWRDGRTLAYIYDPGPEIEEIGKWAYMRYLTENGLDPTVYPSMMLIENELIAMASAHLYERRYGKLHACGEDGARPRTRNEAAHQGAGGHPARYRACRVPQGLPLS